MSHETPQPQNQPHSEQPTEKTTMQKVCDLFLSKDDFRPNMCVPFTIGEYTYATDAHTLIRIPNKLIDFEIVNPEKLVDPVSIVEREIGENAGRYMLNMNDLRTVLDGIEYVDIYADCENCGGSGEIECPHCGHEDECEECDGTGENKNKVIGTEKAFKRVVLRHSTSWKTKPETCFSSLYLERMVKAAEMIGYKEPAIEVSCRFPNNAHCFLFGEILILIMPAYVQNDEVHFTIQMQPCQKQ